MNGDETIRSLREALRLSPDNLALRQLLGDTLLQYGKADDAEREFRDALAAVPDNVNLKVGLAASFYRQGKPSQAIVLVEDVCRRPDAPARAFSLHARLLLQEGKVEDAVRRYKRALEVDPASVDAELSDRLGVWPTKDEQPGDAEVVDGRVRATQEEAEPSPLVETERPKINFKDVGGMESVKDEIRLKIIHPLAHPEFYKAYGKPIGGGILLYGPPGCGKTHLARATAGEIKAGFMAVGINEVLDMWIGNSERNLHAIFERARATRPTVLFFDEVDALAASRTDMRTSGGRHLINQFLAELDGVKDSNDGVLILAATNAPWHVDAAFRRPGRFDRILFIPPPDASARASILRLLLHGKPADAIDFDHLAKKTEHFSGADLKALVDVAIEAKLREAMKTGIPAPLTAKDLAAAAATIRPSTKEWFNTARNYALYANQGGAYDDVLKYLKM